MFYCLYVIKNIIEWITLSLTLSWFVSYRCAQRWIHPDRNSHPETRLWFISFRTNGGWWWNFDSNIVIYSGEFDYVSLINGITILVEFVTFQQMNNFCKLYSFLLHLMATFSHTLHKFNYIVHINSQLYFSEYLCLYSYTNMYTHTYIFNI